MSEHFPEESDPTVQAIDEIRRTMDGQPGAESQQQAPTPLSEAPPDVRVSVIEDMTRLRVLAAEILPSNDADVDIPRIDAFFTRRGLAVQPAIILTPDNLRYYLQRLREMGFTSKSLEELGRHTERDVTPLASYEQRLGLIIALRPEGKLSPLERFKLNYNVAHEKGHSTAGQDVEEMVYVEDMDTMQRNCMFERSGFADLATGEGIFFEEGEAERQAANYTREELGMRTGFWQTTNPEYGPDILASIGQNEPVPLVYLQPAEEGAQPSMTVGALPAYGLELLIKEVPELQAALESDRPAAESRLRIASILNGVEPGLGDDLMRITTVTPDSFNAGLRRIKQALRK
jgi:hypothetical protein